MVYLVIILSGNEDQTDPAGEVGAQFKYDRLNQLVTENNFVKNDFTYDSLGNCVQKNEMPFTVNKLNQLKSTTESQYSYDKNGNVIKQTNPSITYEYDALNRLIKMNQNETDFQMMYPIFRNP